MQRHDEYVFAGNTAWEYLAGMGIQGETLERALRRAFVRSRAVTPWHARNAQGTYFYHELLAALRYELVVQGSWTMDSTNNIESTISPDGRIAILVWSGNPDTGNPLKIPAPRREHGHPSLRRAIDNQQLSVLPEAGRPRGHKQETWVLLHYQDQDIVKAELSLPLGADLARRVVRGWRPRLILPPTELTTQVLGEDVDHREDDINIRVERRGG